MFNKKKDQSESSPVPEKKTIKNYETPLMLTKLVGGI
jgi:hypothetical protein